jgi:GDPmannose 4,6-dehydratase
MENKRKISLIAGITGMDGSHLAELLLEKGYEVHGIIRRTSTFNTDRIDHIFDKLNLHYGDLTDPLVISNLVSQIQPDEVYNLAAQSHVKVSFEIPYYTAQVDGLGTLAILEAVKNHCPKARVYQASTSELYGGMGYNMPSTGYTEESVMHPRSPYGCAKMYGLWITKNYRESYGMHISNGILFNHECISENEPIIIRDKKTGYIKIDSIRNIQPYLKRCSNKQQWLPSNLEIWDGDNFVKINCITATKRDRKNKDFNCRILNTSSGIIETTNHHNLLNYDGDKIKSSDVLVNKTRLRNGKFPKTNEICTLTKDEAFFIGSMVGDGYISIDGKAKFPNNDIDFINIIKDKWLKITGKLTSIEKSYISGFGGKSTSISFYDNFYLKRLHGEIYTKDKFKKIPDRVLNSSKEIQLEFFKGYYRSDGLKKDKCNYEYKSFKTNSSVLAQGLLFIISNTLNQEFTINFIPNKNGLYYYINLKSPNDKIIERNHKYNSVIDLNISGLSQRKISESLSISRKTVSKILKGGVFLNNDHHLSKDKFLVKRDLYHENQPDWVYDIETDSRRIMSGVGKTIISNSERRGETFVTRKITLALAKIKNSIDNGQEFPKLRLGNLYSKRDWGYAKDYVEGMWLMLQQDTPDDYVLSTNETHTIKEFVELACKECEWNINWVGEGVDEKGILDNGITIIEIDEKYYRPAEVDILLGDYTKAKNVLGWEPKVKFEELVRIMMSHDIKNINSI